jgi:hypothetical protein
MTQQTLGEFEGGRDLLLDGVAGVHKPEYGTWAVDVEALLGE